MSAARGQHYAGKLDDSRRCFVFFLGILPLSDLIHRATSSLCVMCFMSQVSLGLSFTLPYRFVIVRPPHKACLK